MNSKLCAQLGIEFPLFAFSHCRDVVAEVTKAGGMGVFGVAGLTTAQLDQELSWIDEQVKGKPYGVDLIVPNNFAGKNNKTKKRVENPVPATHTNFVRDLLEEHDIDASEFTDKRFQGGTRLGDNVHDDAAATMLDVAFKHPIGLIANALGVPPQHMIDRSKEENVPIAALIGSKEHARKQAEAGVDILVAAGGESGGHCGDVSTLVLVPEIVSEIEELGIDIPVLAAGGIVTGRQMAACMSMGAAGAWTGSVWLTTSEAETSDVIKDKLLAATSRDTIRSKSRTGKYSRQLKSAWTDAWEEETAPKPLPMPHQFGLTERALRKVHKLAEGGHDGAKDLATYWVGQGVGMMNVSQSTRNVVYEFMEDFLKASDRLSNITQEQE